MPRLETLSEVQRRTLEFFPCLEHDDTPWVTLSKPLLECRVALVTSAGLHLRDDKPFTRDDPGGESTYRVIPSDCDPVEVVQSHFSIGFDHTGIYRESECHLPGGPVAGTGGTWADWQPVRRFLLLHGRPARPQEGYRSDRPRGGPAAEGR